ncbi:MAG: glycosyltransferase [Acidimicrobiia bacterium]|nr:glycosyltransferase [Acidimicrobiia bacterium]
MPRALTHRTRFVHYHPWLLSRNDSIALVAYHWARAVTAAGYRVELVGDSASDPPPSADDVMVSGVRHVGRGPTLTPIGLGQRLGADDILVLHTDWRFANLFAARVARRLGVPYLVVPHGGYEPGVLPRVRDPLRYRMPAERHLLDNALGVHVFFETEADLVRRFAPRARFVVAPTGFEINSAPEWKGGGGYDAWLGRYDIGHKGLDLLLQALATLPPEARPLVAMHGIDWPNSAAEVAQQARGLGVEASVSVDPPIFGEQKDRFLREADAYLHPARWESYGLAILENVALGAPCLVSSATHLAQWWREDPPFVVCDPTPAGIAAGLQRVRDAAPDKLAERGRELITRDLAWPVVTERFLDGVDRLLAGAQVA